MIICLFQGVDESIKLLQNSGVKVCMITGDGQATATAIATMLGRGCQLNINGPHSKASSTLQIECANWWKPSLKIRTAIYLKIFF